MLIHHWLLVLVDILFHSAIYVILFLNSAPLRETKIAASELAVYAIKMVSYPNINISTFFAMIPEMWLSNA